MGVTKGSTIKISYVAKLKDGRVIDRTEEGQTLELTIGAGKIIPGLEQGLEGMELKETKTIFVNADMGYGQRDESMVKRFPKSLCEDDLVPQVNSMVLLRMKDGESVPAKVVEVTDEEIVIDLNHPLAGQDLIFDVKLEEIK